MTNPFRAKAIRARSRYERLAGVRTAREKAMEQAFPLGPGYGRKGGARRIESSVNRAVASVEAHRRAVYLEAQADAFDQGRINAQGRRINPGSLARSEKRDAAKERREARITAAREAIVGKQRHEITPEQWADANGAFGANVRALVMYEQQERISAAVGSAVQVPTYSDDA